MRSRPGDRLAIVVLSFLPMFLLVVNPTWSYLRPLGLIDPYIYVGYMRDLSYNLVFGGLYQGSRLPWLLAGNVAYSTLDTEYADLSLRLLLFYGGTLSLFVTVKSIWRSTAAALITAVLLGLHTYFLEAISTNYVDGPAVVLMLATCAFLASSQRSRFWPLLVFLAGFALFTAISVNISLACFIPVFAWFGVAFGPRSRRIPVSAALAAVGALCAYLLYGYINYELTGKFNYLALQITAAHDLDPATYRSTSYVWIRTATWLQLPALLFVVATVTLAIAAVKRHRLHPRLKLLTFAAVQLVVPAVLMVTAQITYSAPLETFWYASLLMPFAFVFLGGLLSTAMGRRRWQWAMVAVVGIAALAFLLEPQLRMRTYCFPGCRNDTWFFVAPGIVALVALTASLLSRKPQLALLATIAVLAMGVGLFQFGDSKAFKAQFLMVYDIDDAVWPYAENGRLMYWYGNSEPLGNVYNAAAALRLWFPRLVSPDFPSLQIAAFPKYVNTLPLGVPIVILSSDPDALAKANSEMNSVGAKAEVIDQLRIRHATLETPAIIFRAVPSGQKTALNMAELIIQDPTRSKSAASLVTPADRWSNAGYFILPPTSEKKGFIEVDVEVVKAPIEFCVLKYDSSGCLVTQELYSPGKTTLVLEITDMSQAGFFVIRSGPQPISGEVSLRGVSVIVPGP